MASVVQGSIGGLSSLAGGILGGIGAGQDRGHAQGLVDTGVNAYQEAKVPTNLASPLAFQNYQVAGQLNPALQQYMSAAPSQAAGVSANQNLVNAQTQALNSLKGASQTGMTSADRARMNQIQQQMATQAEGQRQQIMQNYAQRGQAGSGNQLLAELNASQNAAQNANQNSLQAAGQAQTNALNALSQYGGMAGNMNQQQFGQQMQAAQAADALNRFNTQNQIQQQAANVNSKNAAQQFNLQNQQGTMNANTGLANQNQMLQRQGEQQTFADQMQQAAGISGAAMTGANAYNNMGNQIAQGWANVGQGAGQVLGGSGGGSSGGLLGSIFGAAKGGEVPCYADGGPVQQTSKDPNSLLFGSLTDAPSIAAPSSISGQNKPNDIPTTIGQASPWEIGGGLAGSPMDNSGMSMPTPGADVTGNMSPGAQMANKASQEVLAAYGGEIGNPSNEIPNLAYGGQLGNPKEEVPCYSNGGVAGVSTTSRGTYPAYSEGGECYSQGGLTMEHLPILMALASRGGHVPGKPKVKGDSLQNDFVPARLSPGEIVLPRTVAQSDNAPEKAKSFVKRIKENKREE